MSACSFCKLTIGEGWSEGVLRRIDSQPKLNTVRPDILKRVADGIRDRPDRKVKILMPGPGELLICDLCVEQYSEAVERDHPSADEQRVSSGQLRVERPASSAMKGGVVA